LLSFSLSRPPPSSTLFPYTTLFRSYGGTLDNRMRFPLEVFDACRNVWPAEKPISVRISAVDWMPGGMQPEDAVGVARLLKAHGCDSVDVAARETVPDQQPAHARLR